MLRAAGATAPEARAIRSPFLKPILPPFDPEAEDAKRPVPPPVEAVVHGKDPQQLPSGV
jgi:hypothetical protein